MKNDMYTYHYYRNRSLKSGGKKFNYVVQIALFFSAAYVIFILLHLIR